MSAAGFKPLTQKGVNVLINNVTRADLTLEVGAITESVTVEASAALLQTTKSDVNVNLEERAIRNLPLSGYRNFQSLVNLCRAPRQCDFRMLSSILPSETSQPM